LNEGKAMAAQIYQKVNNPEVRELLAIGFPEMRPSMTALIWGFNIAGAKTTGLWRDEQIELLVATAVMAGGATRQSRSHIKASVAMGNKVEAVAKVAELAAQFTNWTGVPLPNVLDVHGLAKELAKETTSV